MTGVVPVESVAVPVTARPLVVELFAGCFGWSAGWLEQGGRAIGFDIEHLPHHGPVPENATLVLQDVLTLHGRQFKDASLILASPPCQEFSFMAMPFGRGKQIAAALRGQGEFPERYTGSRTVEQLTALFNACFRIQREASEAAGRYVPMVVENVKGAQPWVGPAKAHFGSFYLWGDVANVGGRIVAGVPRFGGSLRPGSKRMKYQSPCGARLWKDRETPRLNQGHAPLREQVGTKGAEPLGGDSPKGTGATSPCCAKGAWNENR